MLCTYSEPAWILLCVVDPWHGKGAKKGSKVVEVFPSPRFNARRLRSQAEGLGSLVRKESYQIVFTLVDAPTGKQCFQEVFSKVKTCKAFVAFLAADYGDPNGIDCCTNEELARWMNNYVAGASPYLHGCYQICPQTRKRVCRMRNPGRFFLKWPLDLCSPVDKIQVLDAVVDAILGAAGATGKHLPSCSALKHFKCNCGRKATRASGSVF